MFADRFIILGTNRHTDTERELVFDLVLFVAQYYVDAFYMSLHHILTCLMPHLANHISSGDCMCPSFLFEPMCDLCGESAMLFYVRRITSHGLRSVVYID